MRVLDAKQNCIRSPSSAAFCSRRALSSLNVILPNVALRTPQLCQAQRVHASTNNGENAQAKKQPGSAKGAQQEQRKRRGKDGGEDSIIPQLTSFVEVKRVLVAIKMAYEDTQSPLSREVANLVSDAAVATARLSTGHEPDGAMFGPRQRRARKGAAASSGSGDTAKAGLSDASGSDEDSEEISDEQVQEVLELLGLLLPLATPRMGPREISAALQSLCLLKAVPLADNGFTAWVEALKHRLNGEGSEGLCKEAEQRYAAPALICNLAACDVRSGLAYNSLVKHAQAHIADWGAKGHFVITYLFSVNYSEKELFGPLIQAYCASLGGAWNDANKKSVLQLLKVAPEWSHQYLVEGLVQAVKVARLESAPLIASLVLQVLEIDDEDEQESVPTPPPTSFTSSSSTLLRPTLLPSPAIKPAAAGAPINSAILKSLSSMVGSLFAKLSSHFGEVPPEGAVVCARVAGSLLAITPENEYAKMLLRRVVPMPLDKLDAPTLFSLAKVLFPLERIVDKSFLNRLTEETSRRLRNLPGDQIAACALALPSRSRPMIPKAQTLWGVTLREAVAALNTMTPSGLVSLLYSFSKLQELPPDSSGIVDRICDSLSNHPDWKDNMTGDNVHMVALTLAQLKHYHEPLLSQLIQAGASKKLHASMSVDEVSKLLHCVGLLAPDAEGVFNLFSAAAQRLAPDLEACRTKELVWLSHAYTVTDSNPKITVRAALVRVMNKQAAASAASVTSSSDDEEPSSTTSASSRAAGRQRRRSGAISGSETQLPMLDALVTCLTRRTEELSKLPIKYAQGLLFDMQVWAVLRKELKVPSQLIQTCRKRVGSTARKRTSVAQKTVGKALKEDLGYTDVQLEADVGHGWVVDMVAKQKGKKGTEEQQQGDKGQLIVEVDGPAHFSSNDQYRPLGSTLVRNKCLQKMGFTVVTLNLTEQEVSISKAQAGSKIRQALSGRSRRRSSRS